MGRYFRRRLLTAIPVFFGITFLVFVLLSLSPADVTDLGEGASGGAQQAALEEALGLDKPLPVRYLAWLGGLLSSISFKSWPLIKIPGRFFTPIFTFVISGLP